MSFWMESMDGLTNLSMSPGFTPTDALKHLETCPSQPTPKSRHTTLGRPVSQAPSQAEICKGWLPHSEKNCRTSTVLQLGGRFHAVLTIHPSQEDQLKTSLSTHSSRSRSRPLQGLSVLRSPVSISVSRQILCWTTVQWTAEGDGRNSRSASGGVGAVMTWWMGCWMSCWTWMEVDEV